MNGHRPDRLRRWLLGVAVVACLPACGRDDPKARLEASVGRLQDALEARDVSAAMDLLHDRFRAQGDQDARWARQTMMVMFQRYARVNVVSLGQRIEVDPAPSLTGTIEAQVMVTGAQDLIPERATPYTVRMQWRREGQDWKLYDLRWE